MLTIQIGSRVAIMFDLQDFVGGEAYVFMYNFDLEELYTSVTPVFPDQPNNSTLKALVPDLERSQNPSLIDPIPDSGSGSSTGNPQGNPSHLQYPLVPLIPQIQQVLEMEYCSSSNIRTSFFSQTLLITDTDERQEEEKEEIEKFKGFETPRIWRFLYAESSRRFDKWFLGNRTTRNGNS